MAARAEGRNAETLTAYQKKVRSLEALERKLQRQMDALEATKNREIVDTEGKKLSPKEQKAYKQEVAKTMQENIRKTEASIARAAGGGRLKRVCGLYSRRLFSSILTE